MTDARTFALAPGVTLTVARDEAILLKLTDETMFSLNATGARIIELIAGGADIDAVVATLAVEYQVGRSDVEPDVTTLLNALVSGGLLVAADGREPGDR